MLLYRANACCNESGVARSTNWVMGDMLLMTITMDRFIVGLFKTVVRNMKNDPDSIDLGETETSDY